MSRSLASFSIFAKISDSSSLDSVPVRDFFALLRIPPIPSPRCLIPLEARFFRETFASGSIAEPVLPISYISW